MIVRDRPSPLRLFLVMRGSVLPNIWKSLLGTTLLAVLVTWSHGAIWGHKFTIGTIPFTLIGLPLAIFLAFVITPPTTATGKVASNGANWSCAAATWRASA